MPSSRVRTRWYCQRPTPEKLYASEDRGGIKVRSVDMSAGYHARVVRAGAIN